MSRRRTFSPADAAEDATSARVAIATVGPAARDVALRVGIDALDDARRVTTEPTDFATPRLGMHGPLYRLFQGRDRVVPGSFDA